MEATIKNDFGYDDSFGLLISVLVTIVGIFLGITYPADLRWILVY